MFIQSDYIFSVVDVVRTDSQLEFYGDSKNIARMSDILAVYAWIDPATGYCQGNQLPPFFFVYNLKFCGKTRLFCLF